MKTNEPHNPPNWANKLLEFYCQSSLLEDLQGDLYEHYTRNISKGKFKADAIYWLDVLKFLRIYTVQKPKILNNMNTFILLLNYWKTSLRSIKRNKLFSAINIVGLAISMSVGLLMITFIDELYSYDDFHSNSDRLYRIIDTYQRTDNDPMDLASTSIFVGKQMEESFSEVEHAVTLRRNFSGDAKFGDKVIPIHGLWSSEKFFKVLSYELIQGNINTVLQTPYSLVLTERTAAKLIGGGEYIGKIIRLNEKDNYTITGIVKNPPKNSHMQFEALASFSTYENTVKDKEKFLSWTSVWMYYVYVILKENTDPKQFQNNLDRLAKSENTKHEHHNVTIKSQAITEIVPSNDLYNNIGPNFGKEPLYRLGLLTLMIIFSAAFNYTNLSIARSIRRSKEVGIRKVIGATRPQVFTQFICESLIISLAAVILSFGLFLFLKPEFLNLDEEIQDVVLLNFRAVHALYFIGSAIVVGVLSGLLPAILLSKIKIISVLQNIGSIKLMSGLPLRKILIVAQFALSMGFIISTFIIYRQYQYSINYDLGFSTKNILNIEVQGNDHEILKSYFEQIPEVKFISKSRIIPSTGDKLVAYGKFKDSTDSALLLYNFIDEHYLQNLRFEIIAGMNFSVKANMEKEAFTIVNETLLKRFAIKSPLDGINESIVLDGIKLKIIGVVSDFHHNNLDNKIEPFLFRYKPEEFHVLNLKVESTDMLGTMTKLSNAWEKADNIHPFKAEFFDSQVQSSYLSYTIMIKVIGFLAFLAISIATFGLLGMAVYVTESRLKEISIRKVLGASENNLIYLLSRGFVFLLVISAVIAIPLTYLIFDQVVLAEVAYRAPIGAFEILSGALIIFIIGIGTIGLQTLSAVTVNPAENLKEE